jgi:ribosomal protein S6
MEKTESNVHEAQDSRVYEVGFNLIPKISEGDVPAEVENIKKILSSHRASVIAEEMPRMTQLSYGMAKAATGKREMFDRAYFGWVKFEVDPEAITAITEEVAALPNVLRSIVISTVRESTLSKKVFVSEHLAGETIKKPEMVKEGGKKLTDAEIDSAVDELVEATEEKAPEVAPVTE